MFCSLLEVEVTRHRATPTGSASGEGERTIGPVRYGAVFPQAEFDRVDPDEIVTFVQRLEGAGYDHLIVYDHVLGADAARRAAWDGPYDSRDPFLEPIVLFSYLARSCELELVTGVLVLPQRQTALVAKQVATLSCLAPGRVRLGVGIGWNEVEYRSLGMDFSRRASRLEEQIPLLRRLMTEPTVDHSGPSDHIDAAGILPLAPAPVPIWIGCGAHPAALSRTGSLADGWLPMPDMQPGRGLEEAWATVQTAAREAGRDPNSVGLQAQVRLTEDDIGRAKSNAHRWADAGATAIAVNTLRRGRSWPDGHLSLMLSAAEALIG
jgi:probable F420-dependent oxidoreductase